MRIKMLQTQRGSPDGVTVLTYEAGKEYDLTATRGARELAEVFVLNDWAEEAKASATAPRAAAESPAAPPAPAGEQHRAGARRR